jgi:hypothetical protein
MLLIRAVLGEKLLLVFMIFHCIFDVFYTNINRKAELQRK